MSDKEKIIASLKDKGFLDKQAVQSLKTRLGRKLKEEEAKQQKEIVILKKELTALQDKLVF